MAEEIKNNQKEESQPIQPRVKFDLNKCTRCMACVASCPKGCLEEKNGDPVQVRPADCIKCGACESACPMGAVKVIRE